jgi:hypothetical protein
VPENANDGMRGIGKNIDVIIGNVIPQGGEEI